MGKFCSLAAVLAYPHTTLTIVKYYYEYKTSLNRKMFYGVKMQQEHIQLAGYLIAIFSLFMTFIYMRRSSNLENAVIEVAEQNEAIKVEFGKLHMAYQKETSKTSALETASVKLKEQDAINHKKVNDLEIVLESKNTEIQNLLQNTETYKKEQEARLKAAESQNAALKSEISSLKDSLLNEKDSKKTLTSEIEKISAKLNSAKSEIESSKDELEKATSLVSVLEAKVEKQEETISQLKSQSIENADEEIEKQRKRADRANYFFKTMRGLKDMAEEKARNWEVALELLAAWVLTQKGVRQQPKAIGPLVGEALAQINKESALGELAMDSNAEDEMEDILAAYPVAENYKLAS